MKRNRTKERLKEKELRHLPEGAYQDGAGLILRVEGEGRYWVQRVTINGERVTRGLGGYPLVTLQEARDKCYELRKAAREGRDVRAARETFRQSFEKHWAHREKGLKNESHKAAWRYTMEKYAFPKIGERPVAEITHDEIIAVVSPIWRTTAETARRLLQRLEIIFDIAISRGIRRNANPCTGVKRNLGQQGDSPEHHKALPYVEVQEFIRRLRTRNSEPVTKLAFEFLILTATRSWEVRGAERREIDWEAKEWTVPAARMKAKKKHIVPLSDRAIEILRSPDIGTEGLLFPGRWGEPMSNMTLSRLLKRMGCGSKATIHGFRSSFRDWAMYRRATYLDERTALMSRWADWCA
jgi:integrase